MHNSESIISYSATVSSLVGVFRSLNYVQDLSSATLLGQAVQKLPPNMKEAWSMHTVKRSLDQPTLIDFNDWLKDKAEAHERMKTASGKVNGDKNVPNTATETKTTSKVFAATTSTNHGKAKTENMPTTCVACNEKHPLWRCSVFRKKTPTERAKLVADNKLCFSCFRVNHSFSAPSLANALKKVVKAHTTPFSTVPNEFFRENPKSRIGKIPKLRPVLERQR